MSDHHQVIYVAANAGQAQLLKLLLADHGIQAQIFNETLDSVHFAGADIVIRGMGGSGFYETAPRVVVHQRDAEKARRLALQAEADWQSGAYSAELERLEHELVGSRTWPACPHCSRPRITTCPVCQTSGTEFDEAFLPDEITACDASEKTAELMVICPTCDEPFAPKFPPRCEWCGHRFAGAEPEAQPTAAFQAPDFEAYDSNVRVVIVLLGIAAVLAATAGWFYYILHAGS